MLRLRVCGRIAAEMDGDPLGLPTGDRVRALIGWLALHPGQHPRAELAARLWPGVPEPSARANLRTAVWSVRQCWGPVADQVLQTSRSSVGLQPGEVRVDALDEPAADGELLPGVEDDWVTQERASHRERRSAALKALAGAAEREGRTADAVHWSRQRMEIAPFDEPAHRDLLRRMEIAGDHSGAVLAAREFSQLLHEELGVRPSPATRAVQSRLRPVTSSSRIQLFGRSAEVRALAQVWRAAADGTGQVVVLSGEAGIGKSSLLADLVHRADAAGGRSAIGAGIDVGGETPFGVWLELARALVSSVAPVPAGATWPVELSRLSPELGAALGRPQPPPVVAAPEIERLRVFESVLRLVEWSCSDRPALIALDDAHLADRASLRLTAHIGRRMGRLPLLLMLVRRDRPSRPELDALLADLAGQSVPVTELNVGAISDRDVEALVTSSLRLDDDALRRVVAAAEGNPLLAVESTRALASGSTSPPPNLRTAIRATAGRLPAAAQGLVRILAAAGRPLTGAELDALAICDSDSALDDAIEAAIEAGLLVRTEARLGFRHSLFRDVVYADLADPAALHGRLARSLDGTDRAEIARHLALAGRTRDASREWAAAAAYARSVGALAEAAQFLSRACECAPDDGALWLDLEDICAWAGQVEAREQAWERALALLPAAELAAAWARRGRQFRSVICHPQASAQAYVRAQALLTADSPLQVRAEVLIGLAWSQAVAGEASTVEGLLQQALALLPGEPPAHVVTDVAEIRIHGLIRLGRFAACTEVAMEAEAALDGLPDRAYAVWINAACALACAGDLETALLLADRAVTATAAVPVMLVPCLAARAHLLARLGRTDDALTTVDWQREQAARMDSAALVATADHDAGLVCLELGQFAEAARLLGNALGAPAGTSGVSRPGAALARAEALVRAGDADAATVQLRAAVLEPVSRADQPWALVPRMTGIQALIAAARGDEPLARRRFAEAVQGWRQLLDGSPEATAEGFLATLVDLGRPPVAGLIEPAREIARLMRELDPVIAPDAMSSKER